MSVSLEGNPGCSALGHLYRPDGDRRVCITCGYVDQPGTQTNTATAPSDADESDGPTDGSASAFSAP